MPEVFRCLGFSFFFYSHEHEPVHIHIEGKDGYAVYDLTDEAFVLREMHSIKANDRKKIENAIYENREMIIRKWKEHFEK